MTRARARDLLRRTAFVMARCVYLGSVIVTLQRVAVSCNWVSRGKDARNDSKSKTNRSVGITMAGMMFFLVAGIWFHFSLVETLHSGCALLRGLYIHAVSISACDAEPRIIGTPFITFGLFKRKTDLWIQLNCHCMQS